MRVPTGKETAEEKLDQLLLSVTHFCLYIRKTSMPLPRNWHIGSPYISTDTFPLKYQTINQYKSKEKELVENQNSQTNTLNIFVEAEIHICLSVKMIKLSCRQFSKSTWLIGIINTYYIRVRIVQRPLLVSTNIGLN